MKAAVAEHVADSILTNATTHFESRCRRQCSLLGVDRKMVPSCIANVFRGSWALVDEIAREPLQRSILSEPCKMSVRLSVGHAARQEELRKCFHFHHEITTDGVSISPLYSRPKPPHSIEKATHCDKTEDSVPPSKFIGLDPGNAMWPLWTDSPSGTPPDKEFSRASCAGSERR